AALRNGRTHKCALEAAGVFACSHGEPPEKGAGHRICRFETTRARDFFEPSRGTVDDLLRRFDAHAVHKLARVHSRLAETNAREVAGAHAHTLGERFDGE